jgi:alginate O-acetyltransferase complex protein AlgI
MLFTTAAFALLFLPATLAGFFILGRWTPRGAALWLALASVFFYGYWMPEFTLLLLASIGVNFRIGLSIARATSASPARADPAAKAWLVAGVAVNLLLLAYFKYANFFVDNLNLLTGAGWQIGRVPLPIGISFFTFTQIAFLVDTYQRRVSEYRLIHYGLFVSYFPHLVAGPVLHHAQMMPQFANPAIYRFDGANFTAGLAIFCIGLLKKVVLADGISPYADAIFKPVDAGMTPELGEAWLGALAYTFQLYFDFSGYSDMAIGLSWMFNIRLPFNFDSPYRATSISDFWRRWHISLSNFLRDYLYITLGGNRKGPVRRYANLAITMLLGGLWHGASWSFVLWGGLHGAYLMINHGFRALCGRRVCASLDGSRVFSVVSWFVTMLAVIVAWVFFRSETFTGSLRMLQGMAGVNGVDAVQPLLWNAGLRGSTGMVWCAALAAIAFLAPNSNRIGEALLAAVRLRTNVRAVVFGFALCTGLFLVLLNTARDSVSPFIYFNF